MQIKQWILVAGLMIAAPLLVACGDEKEGDTTIVVPPPAEAPPADAPPADAAPAEEKAE